ncbi:MAG: sigma-70 family RNA polymerase sigma factor [Actinobacteria bacterium]|nr:sigma-70 family RNA polymerase sigma factor [Actinomycetota bacterium]MBU1944436.1 sigma-70 family RNA polymerase sigma factor [Actinomycetota bacterium]MBU2688222.1 sigma-70 family RNA polymerase sigma factor [Actinomycetota bacterium]
MEREWDPVEVASRAARYDREAFAELFDRFFEGIRRYAYFHTGDEDLADDMAAEVFSQALASIENFTDRGGTIGAWLYGIARNVVAGHFRKSGRVHEVGLSDELAEPEEHGPVQTVFEEMSNLELYEALSTLPDMQRDVVVLRFIEGYDVDGVARIVGKRPGAVRALQHRAMISLRKVFGLGPDGKPRTASGGLERMLPEEAGGVVPGV